MVIAKKYFSKEESKDCYILWNKIVTTGMLLGLGALEAGYMKKFTPFNQDG